MLILIVEFDFLFSRPLLRSWDSSWRSGNYYPVPAPYRARSCNAARAKVRFICLAAAGLTSALWAFQTFLIVAGVTSSCLLLERYPRPFAESGGSSLLPAHRCLLPVSR